MNESKFTYNIVIADETGIKTVYSKEAIGCYMPCRYFKGRPIYIGDIVKPWGELQVTGASYCDTDEDLTDDEIYELEKELND